MADIISILSELRSNYNCFDEDDEPYYRALSEAIETVKAERKGYWIIGKDSIGHKRLICTLCGNGIAYMRKFDYCPNCGADMRERSDNGQND